MAKVSRDHVRWYSSRVKRHQLHDRAQTPLGQCAHSRGAIQGTRHYQTHAGRLSQSHANTVSAEHRPFSWQLDNALIQLSRSVRATTMAPVLGWSVKTEAHHPNWRRPDQRRLLLSTVAIKMPQKYLSDTARRSGATSQYADAGVKATTLSGQYGESSHVAYQKQNCTVKTEKTCLTGIICTRNKNMHKNETFCLIESMRSQKVCLGG